jgi:hypothetical protein
MIKTLEERAVLKASTSLDECADMFVSIAKNSPYFLLVVSQPILTQDQPV